MSSRLVPRIVVTHVRPWIGPRPRIGTCSARDLLRPMAMRPNGVSDGDCFPSVRHNANTANIIHSSHPKDFLYLYNSLSTLKFLSIFMVCRSAFYTASRALSRPFQHAATQRPSTQNNFYKQ
ncbi:protein of unknown function [Burkholderia multivorans]